MCEQIQMNYNPLQPTTTKKNKRKYLLSFDLNYVTEMTSEYDEHYVIERIYKIWAGIPDNKAQSKIKEYCGEHSVLNIDKEDGFIVKSTPFNIMKLKNDTKELIFIVESKQDHFADTHQQSVNEMMLMKC